LNGTFAILGRTRNCVLEKEGSLSAEIQSSEFPYPFSYVHTFF
jgi:hypothetical protein